MNWLRISRSRGAAILIAGLIITLVDSALKANVRLTFDSTSLDFGTVAVLGTKDITLNVLDTSTSDIEIDAITPTGSDAGDFTILSPTTPIVVTAGQKIPTQIIIQFSPLAVGTRTASLTLETSDGEVIIPMTGVGAGNASSLRWSSTTVDFGTIAPYSSRDSVIELYSVGTDTALVSELEIAGADTSFSASIVSGPQPPFKLAPGDSVQVQIALHGLPPAGSKFAQLSAIGSTENTPACDLIASVQYGGFRLEPNTIDFGSMYVGEVRDTTVLLIDTSALDLDFETLNLSPDGEDFSITNPIAVPFTIHPGDTLPIIVRANPGVGLLATSQVLAVSPSAAIRLGTIDLTLSASQPYISALTLDSLQFYCANVSDLSDSLEVTNSDTQAIVITGVRFSDSTIPVHALTTFPDTIPEASKNTLHFSFNAASAIADTLHLELIGGNQIMWEDTLILKPTVAVASPVITVISDSSIFQTATVSTSISLQPFGLDSIIIHLITSDPNGATIDPASIMLDSALHGDTIASIVPEARGYRIVVVSASQFSVSIGNPIIHFRFYRYISSSDSVSIQASIETPDRIGCISWSIAARNTIGNEVCGGPILQNALSNSPIILDAVLLENPIVGQSIHVQTDASAESEGRFEITNALGKIVSSGSFALHEGRNDVTFLLPDALSGTYMLDLRPLRGTAKLLPFVKIR